MSLIKKTICLETKILTLKKKNKVQFDFSFFFRIRRPGGRGQF